MNLSRLQVSLSLGLLLAIALLVGMFGGSAWYANRVAEMTIIPHRDMALVSLIIGWVAVRLLLFSTTEGHWSAYHFAILTLGWLLLDDVALLLLLIGAHGVMWVIQAWWHQPTERRATWLATQEMVVSLASTGYALLMARLLSLQIGVGTPTTASEVNHHMLDLLLIWAGSYGLHQIIRGIITVDWSGLSHYTQDHLLRDVMLGVLAIVTASIYSAISPLAFMVVFGLIIFQAVRVTQVRFARLALLNRIGEVSTLANLVRSDKRGLDVDSILATIHKEVGKAVTFDVFFIVRSDDDNYGFDYAFVQSDGQYVSAWDVPASVDEIVRLTLARRSYILCERHRDCEYISKNAPFGYESLLVVPLQVGMRMIGVLGILHREPHRYTTSHVVKLQTIAFQASLMLRNALLYETSVKMTRQLAHINKVMQPHLLNTTRDVALGQACELACDIASSPKAAIFLLDKTSLAGTDDTFKMVAQVGIDIDLRHQSVTQTLSLKHQLMRYEHGLHIVNDVNVTQDAITRASAERLGFEACLEVPLQSGQRLIGYLGVYHEHPRHYSRSVRHLMDMMANQISALLDNTDMLETLERYAAEQAQLAHLTRITTASLSLNAVIYNTCQSLRDILECDRVEVALREDDGDNITFYKLSGDDYVTSLQDDVDADTLGITIEIKPSYALPEMTHLMDKASYYMEQFGRTDVGLSAGLGAWLDERDMDNVMVVPLPIKHETIGFMMIGRAVAHRYEERELRLMEMTCNQIALQIHNARIHTTTNTKLMQRLTELGMIETIVQQISQALNERYIINGVLEAALQSTGADMALIALEGNEGYEVILHERLDGIVKIDTRRLGLEHNLLRMVQINNAPIIASDTTRLPNYFPVGSRDYVSLMAVPIASGDSAIGVLSLESQQGDFFTQEQLGFIQGIAGHASISIENAKLLAERQHQISTLDALRQLTLEATRIVTRRGMADLVLGKSINLLGGFGGWLYTYDEDVRSVRLIAQGVLHNGRLQGCPMHIDDERVATWAQQGTVSVVNEVSSVTIDERPCASLLALPIRRRERIANIMLIGFEHVWHLEAETRQTLDLLTAQVASHLEHASLNEAIRKQNDQMRTILDANRDGIILLDRHGSLQEANPAAETIMQIKLNDFIHQPYADILRGHLANSPDNEAVYETIITRLERDFGEIVTRHYELSQKGREISVQEIGAPVMDSEGRIMGRLLSLRDITEERMLQEYRQRLQNMLYHDLRSPLSAIISGLYLANAILEDPQDTPLEQTLTPTLKVSLDSANYLLSLLDTLRDIPRLEKGQMPLKLKALSLKALIDRAINTLTPSMQSANITPTVKYEGDASLVLVDEDIIQRVIINLLHNAFKFTPPGGEILMQVTRQDAGLLRVMVCDTGPGIPPAMRERIFNEFEQIEGQKPSQGGKGSGLGLTFCKLAVEAHRGRIWVEPEGLLSGACFAFTLPIAPEDAP